MSDLTDRIERERGTRHSLMASQSHDDLWHEAEANVAELLAEVRRLETELSSAKSPRLYDTEAQAELDAAGAEKADLRRVIEQLRKALKEIRDTAVAKARVVPGMSGIAQFAAGAPPLPRRR